ncbi:hypothetical protein HN630_04850 [archaeon]|nr:hypothetical protein [archaeon]MBT7025505.1 hypothetical protein [archaeon]MBT7568207.1 hypothetical protein [archaeon]
MKKNAMQMAISTIILIILGIAILVGLIFMLVTQTGIFSDYLGTVQSETNVDTVASACDNLVLSNQNYAYCCEVKEVVTTTEDLRLTCDEFVGRNFVSDSRSLNCSAVSC